jgi:hypothetical protein
MHIHMHTCTHAYIHICIPAGWLYDSALPGSIHTCTYVHTHAHTYMYMYSHAHTYMYIYVYLREGCMILPRLAAFVHAHTYIHIHIRICTCTHTFIHIYMYTCGRLYDFAWPGSIHTYTLTYAYVYTLIYTYIHVYLREGYMILHGLAAWLLVQK